MGPGKVASQAAHAFLDAYLIAQDLRPDTIQKYKNNHGIKVVLESASLQDLEVAHAEAVAAGLPAVLVTDLGYTVFDGVPTITALGIGPALRSETDPITKKFKLME